MTDVQRITIPYAPRTQFQPFHNREQRFAIIVAHRRAGKTVACVNELIRGALVCGRENPRLAYIAPLYKQAKDVAWNYVRQFTAPLCTRRDYNETELRVDLPNGGRVRLYGADNPDALRGIYLDGVVLDEYADMDGRLWPEVIRPALADRQGWAVFIGTPRGRNAFYDLWRDSASQPDWYRLELKASETGLIDPAELEAARHDMSASQFEQEFECSFDAPLIGSYYGDLMTEALKEGRITRVPHNSGLKVETWWDLGMADAMAIWFVQRHGPETRIIDYLEGSGEGLKWYVDELTRRANENGYRYSDYVVPHDARVRELGTGKSRLEVLEGLGCRCDVAPDVSVADGIEAVRRLLPECWFDAERCERGIEALKAYRKEPKPEEQWQNSQTPLYKDKPLHDWASHAADAFRYGALHKPRKREWGKINYPKSGVA